MDKRIILLVLVITLFSLAYYVYAYTGCRICGVDYYCHWTSDSVCPENYGATCRGAYCDSDCSYAPGEKCHINADCPEKACYGPVRYCDRFCTYDCVCSFSSSEDCNSYDNWYDTSGWYCNGVCQRYKTQAYWDYYCRSSDATCQYTVTGTRNYYENAPYGQHCSGGTWTTSGYCGSSGPSCNSDSQYQEVTRYECDGSNNCNVYDYKDSYNCGAKSNTCPNICTARYTYTCSSGNCGIYTSDSYPSWNQVCSAGSIVGGSCGTDGCVNDYYYRDYGCSSGTCTYTDDDCRDCSCSCGNYNTNEANFCTDGRDNNCNGLTDRMDPACGVSITSIEAPDTVDKGQQFTVKCGSSVGPVNCISATIAGRACTWTGWDGSKAVFACTCNANTCPITETVRCFVNTGVCAALSPAEMIKSIICQCSSCNYPDSTSCNADSRCTWCNQCYSTKYTGAGARCVAAGTCSPYCWNGQCGATCDNTQGGCTATSQCSGTIYQTRSWSCLDICACSYGSWVSGTCAQSKANCGAQCAAESDCTASLTQCSGTIYQTRTRSCNTDPNTCSCSYGSWVSGTCAQSKASCSAQCGSASDCPSSCSPDTKYLYSSGTCGSNCICAYTTTDCTNGYPKCVNTVRQYNPYCDSASGTCKYSTQDCGTNGCDTDRFCCNSNTAVCRTCHNRGCTSGACYDTTYPNVVATCGADELCSNGQCTCTNKCTLGATRCLDASTQQTCITGANGCTDWGSNTNCPYGCANNNCNANTAPTLTSVVALPGYVKNGAAITITSVSSDPNNDMIKLVCGSSSGSSNLCIGLYVASNPSCTFTSPWSDNIAHTIYCRAYDGYAYSTEKTASVTADNTVPTIITISHSSAEPIVNPGATASITITATADDAGSGISKIDIYVGGQLKKTCTASPCDYSFNYGSGTYQYYIIVTDSAGNTQQSSTASFTVAECGAGYECAVRNSQTCRYNNAGAYEWVTSLGTEGPAASACTDSHDNDCDSKTDRLDPTDCGVEIRSISISNSCPQEGVDTIDVRCTSSVADVNCIGAYIDYNNNNARDMYEDCIWNPQSYWSGSEAVFANCSAGTQTGTPCKLDTSGRKAECYVNTSKCAQVGTNKLSELDIDVSNDPCAAHDQSTCNNDPKCKWTNPCSMAKFYQFTYQPNGVCIRSGITITYNCVAGKCSAACDGSVGCPAYLSGNNCYYNGVCDEATTCSCSYSSAYCPASGTIDGTTCYYGTRTCTSSGYGLSTGTLTNSQVCTPTGPTDPSSSSYEAIFDVYIPNKKSSYYPGEAFDVRVKAYLRNKATGATAYNCDLGRIQGANPVCKINSILIDTATGTRNYMTEKQWSSSNTNNFVSAASEWKLPIDTNTYHSTITVGGDIAGIAGSDQEGYTVTTSELAVTINYPDVDNYLVPLTATGKPNFTMTMPIRFFAKAEKVGLITTVCESPDCDAIYWIDAGAQTAMTWDEYEKKFYASQDSTLLPMGFCDKYHTLYVKVTNPADGISKTEQSDFFLSCTPRITAFPPESRFVLGAEGLKAFNVTMWNPGDAATFVIEMLSTKPENDFVLGWLSFNCLGQPDCTVAEPNKDMVTLHVDKLGSKNVQVDLSTANRAGSYELIFKSTNEDKTYTVNAFVLVFSELLYEFGIVNLAALFVIAIIIFAYDSDIFKLRKKR